MPMTLDPIEPQGLVGPGLFIRVGTNSLTALPSWTWSLNFYSDSDMTATIATAVGNYHQNAESGYWGENNIFFTWGQLGTGGVTEGSTVYWKQQLQDPTFAVQDSGTGTAVFSGVAGIGRYIQQVSASTGGLTSTEATQLENASTNTDTLIGNWNTYTTVTLPSLQDVLNSIISGITATITGAAGAVPATLAQLFSWITLDKLTLTGITSGETCDPVDVTLGGSFTGVIIRATTIPDSYPFTGPGDTWTPLDLAVIEFVRGSDVLKRFGMHTTTHMEYPLPGLLTIPATELPVDLLPPDYHLKIWWGNGVCGEAFAMVLP